MIRILSFLVLSVSTGAIFGAPPVAGGFMTGGDSAIYVYWFHAETLVWESGIKDDSFAYDIVPATSPGFYSMAQRIPLPPMSFVTTFSERLYLGDHYPAAPGNQFTPFGFSVFLEGVDSLPAKTPLLTGRDSLLSEHAAGDGWIHHPVGIPNLIGENLWFSHDWDNQTPSAPEIKAVRLPNAKGFNKLGIGPGETRQWSGLDYVLDFRYRFLTLIVPDTGVADSWRRVEGGPNPDGFLITRYGSREGNTVERWCNSPDTLFRLLPDGPGDSVGIRVGCDGDSGGDELVLAFDSACVLPIAVEVDCAMCDSSSGICEYYLKITSRSPDTVRLSAGYDQAHIQIIPKPIVIPPFGSTTIPMTISGQVGEERRFLIILEDASPNLYPYLIIVHYFLSWPMEADEPTDIPPPAVQFSVAPNPIISIGTVRFKTAVFYGRFEIFNILGQRVAEFPVRAGGETVWDERDDSGRLLPSGLYFARLIGGRGRPITAKIILVR